MKPSNPAEIDPNDATKADAKKQEESWSVFSLLAIGVAIIWLGLAYTFDWKHEIVHSIFSALAFATIIYSIRLQRKDLNIQRAELAQQNRTLKYQRFDNTFFNLVSQYNQLQRIASEDVVDLQNCLRTSNHFSEMQSKYTVCDQKSKWGNVMLSRSQVLQDTYGVRVKSFEAIVESIDEVKKKQDSRQKYFKLFFSQLSNWDLVLLFYHFHLRQQEKPKAFDEYKNYLFQQLHGSPLIPDRHFMMIMNHKALGAS